MLNILYILLLFLGPREESRSLITVEHPQRQYKVGDNVEVPCRSDSPNVQITWSRLGTNEFVDSKVRFTQLPSINF